MLPCRRFADVLADACARLGADVDRYSFIEVDLHHKLLAGLPAHSLALRPAHSRRHLYVTSYTEGFSHFVTSMTAPVASGWSVRRVGLAPTGKRRLLTAHAKSGHSANKSCVRPPTADGRIAREPLKPTLAADSQPIGRNGLLRPPKNEPTPLTDLGILGKLGYSGGLEATGGRWMKHQLPRLSTGVSW